MQTCIWPSWCHCHSLFLASVKSRLVLPFWYRLTRVVPEKRAVKRVCVCVCVLLWLPGMLSLISADQQRVLLHSPATTLASHSHYWVNTTLSSFSFSFFFLFSFFLFFFSSSVRFAFFIFRWSWPESETLSVNQREQKHAWSNRVTGIN